MKVDRPAFMTVIAATALGAIAAWPWYVHRSENAAHAATLPTPAPISADYLRRDKIIAFWERAAAEHHRDDMLSPSMLSAQYMQRYRERGDIGDLTRALYSARMSLRAQPYGNLTAEIGLGSAFLALHRFHDALKVTRNIERFDPGDSSMIVREASIDLEIGDYASAKRIVERLRRASPAQAAKDLGGQTLIARYDELTGHLARARERLERITAYANAQYEASAQERAWFYFRSGEMAFEAGDNEGAIADEQRSLGVFPDYSEANRALARVECALHRWQDCLAAAQASAKVIPYPEVVGYEVDAQRALSDANDAAQNDDLIRTIERIGNAQHISDRLLAIYYSDHNEHLQDAYRIATRELAVRDDVLTEDTLAWCAATIGRWNEARMRSARALQYGTQNSVLLYHAGMIALHFGDRAVAQRRLQEALALNPQFHPVYADQARAELSSL